MLSFTIKHYKVIMPDSPDALEAALPQAKRITLRELGYIAAENDDHSEKVAAGINHIFSGNKYLKAAVMPGNFIKIFGEISAYPAAISPKYL